MKSLINPLDESMRKRDWINWAADGSYTERWERGFRRHLYHGRTGAYFRSESILNLTYEQWTLPELQIGVNDIGAAPWNNALRMRNSQDGVTEDEVYVAFPRAHHNQVMCFEANIPAVSTGTDMYPGGFEVNSGGSFALLCAIQADGAGGWDLLRLNYGNRGVQAIVLRHGGVWARYALVYAPTVDTGTVVATANLQLWQAPLANRQGFPLERTNTLSLDPGGLLPYIKGKAVPFFANETTGSITEFLISNVWVYEII